MPIYMRLGKQRGPYSKDAMPMGPHRTKVSSVNVRDLERFDGEVTPELLKEAGLVIDEPRGTRRIYQLHARGVQAVQAYLLEVWGDAATRFKLLAENTKPSRRKP